MTALTFRTGTVDVNDIFSSSWGWEQTNVNFYQVISTHGKKTVIVREVRAASEYDAAGMSGTKKAVLNDFIGEPLKRQVKDDSDRPNIKIEDYEYAYKSEPGEKHSFTSYA
ncbi:hypothetical protein CJP72_09140 [Citrobacter sp. NCU1]|uniref:hypothetical protein n=1 Tax=Citrobacter sp. NCU1 TaxID=2026683 RepID=UPI001391593C|nr:hypothetical protein [Citrobacter sp. NCU1]NDO80925.1 hypothetical protein [Citrobacter sp. NCU1]